MCGPKLLARFSGLVIFFVLFLAMFFFPFLPLVYVSLWVWYVILLSTTRVRLSLGLVYYSLLVYHSCTFLLGFGMLFSACLPLVYVSLGVWYVILCLSTTRVRLSLGFRIAAILQKNKKIVFNLSPFPKLMHFGHSHVLAYRYFFIGLQIRRYVPSPLVLAAAEQLFT